MTDKSQTTALQDYQLGFNAAIKAADAFAGGSTFPRSQKVHLMSSQDKTTTEKVASILEKSLLEPGINQMLPTWQAPLPRSQRSKVLKAVVASAYRLHEAKHLSDAGLAEILEAVDGE